MYCCMRNSVNKCSYCDDKYIVMADVDIFQTEYFCFDTFEDARVCYDAIEKHNFYYGLHFRPKTAILLKPATPYFDG